MEELKRRTCGYARVSSDKDEQFTSYEAQVDYYTKYIKRNPEWEFVDVYTDEGITGTNTKKRDGFNQMVRDALDGKIDLIVTKSVSRFARNTVDSLVTIRKLKEKGVEVYFEKENIWTLDSNGELLITIMSSLAQDESRNISENVIWGKRRKAEEGQVTLAYSSFLGYDKGDVPGNLVVNQEQAKLVKRIYRDFMKGMTPWTISQRLTKEGIPTPMGKSQWTYTGIMSILSNEKYKGDAIIQKTYTVDYLTKRMKKNNGEVPQFYIEENHEAIIPPDEWDRVQKEIERRKGLKGKYSGNSLFAARLVCADCGEFFGSKVWNSTDPKYRRVIWQCNHKFKGEQKCTTPHLTESEIKDAFIKAFNILFDNKDEVIENCRMIADMMTDCTAIDRELADLNVELETIAELTKKCIHENATMAQNQDEYINKYNSYVARFEETKAKITVLEEERRKRALRIDTFKDFIKTFSKAEGKLLEFDEDLWSIMIDYVKVYHNKALTFVFQSGAEIEVTITK